jgi:hypothetical protein
MWVLWVLLAPVGAAVGARHLRSAAPEEMEERKERKGMEAIARDLRAHCVHAALLAAGGG